MGVSARLQALSSERAEVKAVCLIALRLSCVPFHVCGHRQFQYEWVHRYGSCLGILQSMPSPKPRFPGLTVQPNMILFHFTVKTITKVHILCVFVHVQAEFFIGCDFVVATTGINVFNL